MKRFIVAIVFLFLLASAIANAKEGPADAVPPELDAYIAQADDSFQWTIVEKTDTATEKTFVVELTSQTWHDIPWKHFMLIAVPNKLVSPNHAVLYIGGKGIGRKPGEGDKMFARMLAEAAGMCSVQLFQVPNQPLFGNYVEDALIGETLLKAIETKDATWPLLFPMAKSAVKAMDAVQQILEQEKKIEIKHFIVAGASKRGWTTWLTAATGDKRVVAIAPTVIDTLNIRRQMPYQIETWGDFSPSIHDYTDRHLVEMDETKVTEFQKKLWTMIDPYAYRSRLTLPKLLIHGTNDPYWTVDATKHYWEGLPGTKYILTLPNVGHGLNGQELKAAQTLAVFAKYAAAGLPWPKMDWKFTEDSANYSLAVESDIPVLKAKLWTAQSETKDFRKAKWTPKNVTWNNEKTTVTIPKPETGHVAFFVELESSDGALPFSLTTQVWRY